MKGVVSRPFNIGLIVSALLHLGGFLMVGNEWWLLDIPPAQIQMTLTVIPQEVELMIREEIASKTEASSSEVEGVIPDDIPGMPAPESPRDVTLSRQKVTTPPRRETVAVEGIPLETEDPRYLSYFQILKAEIYPVWASLGQSVDDHGRAIVRFTVLKDGSFGGYEFVLSTRNSRLDFLAIEALRRASPFYPIPDHLHLDSLPVVVEFDY